MSTEEPAISAPAGRWTLLSRGFGIAVRFSAVVTAVLVGAEVMLSEWASSPDFRSLASAVTTSISPQAENEFIPVVMLAHQDCLEYLWFAKLVKRRLHGRTFSAPLVHIGQALWSLPWRSAPSEMAFRNAGFEVLSTTRLSAMQLRTAVQLRTPSLLIFDRNGEVRAVYRIRPTAHDMYAVVAASRELAEWAK